SALQAQGRRAFERKREIYITDFVALLKIIFSLDGNIIGCPLYPPYIRVTDGMGKLVFDVIRTNVTNI
ncbi:MAG: hypothetical protein WA124_01580, partial [Smithella sp.]